MLPQNERMNKEVAIKMNRSKKAASQLESDSTDWKKSKRSKAKAVIVETEKQAKQRPQNLRKSQEMAQSGSESRHAGRSKRELWRKTSGKRCLAPLPHHVHLGNYSSPTRTRLGVSVPEKFSKKAWKEAPELTMVIFN